MPCEKNAGQSLLVLSPQDNVAVLKCSVPSGSVHQVGPLKIEIRTDLEMGHKVAIAAISAGEDVLKYGVPIGFATHDISPGEHVHLHNLSSRYTTIRDWEATHHD